jgi:hypothetical protein
VVAFDPEHPQSSSVPLINIRYAVSRAVRRGQIDAAIGRRLVAVAVDTYYPDRRWRQLVRNAGVDDTGRQLESLLSSFDLKRKDALIALRRVARRLSEAPGLSYQPRRSTAAFVPTEAQRERTHSALDGISAENVKPALARFVVGTGRHHELGIQWAQDGFGPPPDLAERIWNELARRDDLDAEIYRWRAVHTACERARLIDVSPLASHHQMAEQEIAGGHGYGSWQELESALEPTSELWTLVMMYREELAWAKCLRAVLFKPD